MTRMAKSNIFAGLLIFAQCLLLIFLISMGDMVRSSLPFSGTATGLIILNQLFSVFVPSIIFIFILFPGRGEKLKRLRIAPISFKNLMRIFWMSIFIQPLMSVLALIAQLMFAGSMSDVAFAVSEEMPFLGALAAIALTPAIFEELALRGVILGAYEKELGERRIILINGLFFGLIHLNGQQLFYAVALGVFFSFIVLRTGSIFAGMIAHFTINASQTTFLFLVSRLAALYDNAGQEAYEAVDALPPETSAPIIMGLFIAMTIVFVSGKVFFKLLSRFSKHNPIEVNIYDDDHADSAEIPQYCSGEAQSLSFDSDEPSQTEPYEIAQFKDILKNKNSLSPSYYVTFTAVILLFLLVMLISGCGFYQLLILFIFCAFFFFTLFFRVRS